MTFWQIHRILLIACMTAIPLGGSNCLRAESGDVAPSYAVISQTINRLVRDGYHSRGIEPASRCDDPAFGRRVYLDLAGRIPTPSELASWMEDEPEGRRERLVDSLLSSEDHVQHFTDLFDALLMGRAEEDKYAQRNQHHWRAYLEEVVRQNRPWNDVVEEILLARPEDEQEKGSLWFLYERQDDHQKIAEAIAPAVFGIRVECAQCHDHMLADEIKQAHYWGLVAFFNRSKNENKDGELQVAESAVGGFSDFADLSGGSTPNYLTFLEAPQVEEARPDQEEKETDSDDLYLQDGTSQAMRVPKFSRRERFVTEVVRNHPRVARAMVNRVWAILMGRGIVHPYDEMDSTHDASHPELLDWLSQDFVEHGYDVRRLVQGIVMSDPYQLESIRPAGVDDPASFAWYLERPLTGEQLARSLVVAIRGESDDGSSAVSLFRQQFPDVLPDEAVSSVKDALFLSNNADLDTLIKSSKASEHLMSRLLALPSRQEQVELLFQTLFLRPVDPNESTAVAAYLDARADRLDEAMEQVVWSMLTSAEFRFNH